MSAHKEELFVWKSIAICGLVPFFGLELLGVSRTASVTVGFIGLIVGFFAGSILQEKLYDSDGNAKPETDDLLNAWERFTRAAGAVLCENGIHGWNHDGFSALKQCRRCGVRKPR